MDKIKGYYRGVLVTLYKIKEYDSLKVRKEYETVAFGGDMWIGFCGPYGVYAIYASDNYDYKICHETYRYNGMTLSFANKTDDMTNYLSCDGRCNLIEFDSRELMWKIYISAEQPESVLEELNRIWRSAAKHEQLNEELFRSITNSFYGLAVPDPKPRPLAFTSWLNMVHKYRNALPDIKDVIFNAPATIVFWEDGTKTVVKAQDEEDFDPEKGLSMAISKKALGNRGNYYETIKKWLKKG